MTSYGHELRGALADALRAVGPDAPTLCKGWLARDLAAHVVLRERRPDAASGIVLRRMAGYTERVQHELAAGDFEDLVEQIASPPFWSPFRIGFLEDASNVVEFFVHTEDVRRAQPHWSPCDIDPGLDAAVWRAVRARSRLLFRHVPVSVRLSLPDGEAVTVGSGAGKVEITGPAGELLMFAMGRQSHALVEVSGDAADVKLLRSARLGL